MLMSGLRDLLLSAYVGMDYAELSHFDDGELGPTVGFRASKSNVSRPWAHHFVLPTLQYGHKNGVIIKQPQGAVTLWFGYLFEHTSSVDEYEYDVELAQQQGNFKVVSSSVGLVIVQKGKLLSLPEKHKESLEKFISFPILNYRDESKPLSKAYGNEVFKKDIEL